MDAFCLIKIYEAWKEEVGENVLNYFLEQGIWVIYLLWYVVGIFVLGSFSLVEYLSQVVFQGGFYFLLEERWFYVVFWFVEWVQEGLGQCLVDPCEKLLYVFLQTFLNLFFLAQHQQQFKFYMVKIVRMELT